MAVKESKKQHFLPFVYLKYFRCDIKVEDRNNATILRDDGSAVIEEKVANQCYANNFYRKENTKESEEGFGALETDWHECVVRARSGENESALLMTQILMYHFRNISIRVLTDDMDRYSLVTTATANFLEQKILRLPKDVRFTDDPSHVHNFPWLVRIIKFNKPLQITSDNPSVLTIRTKKCELYGPFFLPISPTELLIAIDNSKFLFCGAEGIDKDAYIANAAVAAQSSRHIYNSEPMGDSVRNDLWDFLSKHRIQEHEKGKFEKNGFIPTHPVYDNPFTFIKLKPNVVLQNTIRQAIRSN